MDRRTYLTVVVGMATASGCLGQVISRNQKTLSDYSCPSSDNVHKTVCSHKVDTDEADIYLLPSTTSTPVPHKELQFTLYNKSRSILEFNPYSNWTFWERTVGGWGQIEQQISISARAVLQPGSTKTWDAEESTKILGGQFQFSADVYAAGINVPDPNNEQWIRCVALFRVLQK
jgi:hypothetical protein